MTAYPVLTDVFRTTFNYVAVSGGPSGTAHNVMHFKAPGKTAAQLATALAANWQANQTAWLPNTIKMGSYSIIKLDGSSASADYAQSPTILGQNAGEPIPAVCCIIKLRTGLQGRQNRGRIYLPWVNEAAQNAGVMDSTRVTNMQTAWTAYFAALATAGFTLHVASYVGAHSNPMTTLTVESICGTQRRRQQALRHGI